MRTVIVRDAMRITLGKQGENNAVRVVWVGVVDKYAKLYGEGHFELVVVQRGQAYPAVVNVDGADLVWDVRAADTATAEVGSLELIYYAGDTIVKSKTWETVVVASKSADGMTEPPEDPARAWFDAIKRQIGDLSKLTTKAKENLVAAINEAATTGSGGGSVEMRVDGGYIQYSTDGVTWENLISVASLEGKPGKDGDPGAPGAPGKDGEPGKDGHTPKIAATKTGKTTSITADGVEIAQIKDGEDAAADLSLGITGATVGQIAKITAVDGSGKPTEWEAVDGVDIWEIIAEYTASEAASWLNINKDANGNAFSLRKVKVEIILPNEVGGGTWYLYLSPGTQFFGTTGIQATGSNSVRIQCEAESDDIVSFASKKDKNFSNDMFYLERSADYTTITAVRFGNWSDLTFPAGTKVLVKGVRA